MIWHFGEDSVEGLLVLSQVILSLQLGFAVIPLIHFVSNKDKMKAFTIRPYTKIIAWLIAALIIAFNVKLIIDTYTDWFAGMSAGQWWLKDLVLLLTGVVGLVLLYITFEPLVRLFVYISVKKARHYAPLPLGNLAAEPYKKIAITVDFTITDRLAITEALAQGGKAADYILINIIETANAILSEEEVADMQAGANLDQLKHYAKALEEQGYHAEYLIGYGRRTRAIAQLVKDCGAQLLVMGAHGHRGLKDLLFGETINSVRHRINIPLLAVKQKAA